MNKPNFDVIIIGSGPAGTSAAYPLLNAGLKVLMVDGGKEAINTYPQESFLTWRQSDIHQHARMIGKDNFSHAKLKSSSPKMRIPGLSYAFNDFSFENHGSSDHGIAISSLATGGLSNVWGCGVATFSDRELSQFPFDPADIQGSYATVAKRIGISGSIGDDLSDYFGVDSWAQPPIDLDPIHRLLEQRYRSRGSGQGGNIFRLGRTRLATLSQAHNNRLPCNLSGNCLWGCSRRSQYTSAFEISPLMKFPNFFFFPGLKVDSINSTENFVSIQGIELKTSLLKSYTSRKIFIAAGTLPSTKLSLKLLKLYDAKTLQSCPTAGFMAWIPKFLGHNRVDSFGSGQLAFSMLIDNKIPAYGATFSPQGIPVSEFLRHVPLAPRYGISFLRSLLSSCVVGNFFLPGEYGGGSVKLKNDGDLQVSFKPKTEVADIMKNANKILSSSYRTIGAYLIPGSFTVGQPGGDIHYSGTLPMKKNPGIGETNTLGQLTKFNNVHVIDGSCLTSLPEKPHTLTIMANADRIALGTLPSLLSIPKNSQK